MKKRFLILPLLFNAHFAYGYITNDVVGGCDNPYYLLPHFEINQYNCASGYYLPAGMDWLTDNDGCRACPDNTTCIGGIYTYDENNTQGIEYNNFIPNGENGGCSTFYSYMAPRFVANQYNCNPGYYLPADSIECVMCPNDSYCGGGTYTFNETVSQGIVSCASGLFAPAGMWEPEQCGRILHVGDGFVYLRATKKTSPSLHLDLDHDGVADYFGNMTTLDVPMSSGTQRKLKLRYDNTTYSVYDDSVDLSLYE